MIIDWTQGSIDALSTAGWRVDVLQCGARQTYTGAAGATDYRLDDFPTPAELTLDGPNLFPSLHDSDRVLHALQALHQSRRYDLIVFPDRGGLGFRAIQAKQAGLTFADVRLAVATHGTSFDAQHQRQQWLHDWRDVSLDHAERYAAEFADVRFATNSDAFTEATTASPVNPGAAGSHPLVTICVPYFNLADYLEETLNSLARQAYPHLEVIVINDGSTQPHANEVFRCLQTVFPRFRFLEQANAGIGATRNRGLHEARGAFFLPVDADNIARPDMVERFVRGLEHQPAVAALSCYFLAFHDTADIAAGRFAYAVKPTGGPRVLGCLQNVYGDANAMFRTEALRTVGGFETDRDTSFEDWEVFVKLVNRGYRVDVLPDFLFYYRHRAAGFSRVTNGFRNHQRVLRRFEEIESLPGNERRLLWNWLVGAQQRIAEMEQGRRATAANSFHLPTRVKRALVRLWATVARRGVRLTRSE